MKESQFSIAKLLKMRVRAIHHMTQTVWENEKYYKQLKENPRAVYAHMLGCDEKQIDKNIKFHLIEEDKSTTYIVLPPHPEKVLHLDQIDRELNEDESRRAVKAILGLNELTAHFHDHIIGETSYNIEEEAARMRQKISQKNLSLADFLLMNTRVKFHIVEDAWRDPSYLKHLKQDPKGVFAENFGCSADQLDKDHTFRIIEEDLENIYLVIPPNPKSLLGRSPSTTQALEENELEQVAGGLAPSISSLLKVSLSAPPFVNCIAVLNPSFPLPPA